MIRRLHLPLFLLAVVCAVGVKIAVDEERQLTETTVIAQLTYKLPEGVTILEPVTQVEVRLRGELSEIAKLNSLNLQGEVTLKEGELGRVDITDERLVVRGPADFEVVSKNPNFFTLTIEKVVRRTLPIRAELTGEPSAGAVPGTSEVHPENALVEGPSSRVDGLSEITVLVSLDGHAFDFSEVVAVVPPDPLVRVTEPRQVVVRVPLTVPGSETPDEDLLDEPTEEF